MTDRRTEKCIALVLSLMQASKLFEMRMRMRKKRKEKVAKTLSELACLGKREVWMREG